MIQSVLSFPAFPTAARNAFLWRTLVTQELAARYRATVLGAVWQVLAPLLQLAVYGFVFGVVYGARWPGSEAGQGVAFVLNVFLGLVLHGLLAETLGQAPTLLQRHSNFVRKVVFPLPVLVAVPLGVGLVNVLAGLALVVGGALLGGVLLPAGVAGIWQVVPVLLAFAALVLGVALMLAAVGVYVRDLGQIIAMVTTAILFTSPVFYPRELAPEAFRQVIAFNPLTVPLEHLRSVLLLQRDPDWGAFAAYAACAALCLLAGAVVFRTLRRGFADML